VLVVEVVDEGALLAVVKEDPHHAEAAGEGGVFLLDNLAPAPGVVSPVFDHIAQLQVQSLHFLYYNKHVGGF
jgi:hypothetical protein